jgi:hypothetical protein
MEPWLSFYKPHFPSQLAAEQSVEACENLESSGANHVAKIMMHQAQRLVSIVDDLPNVSTKSGTIAGALSSHVGRTHI